MGLSARAAVWMMTIAAGLSTIILSAERPQRATADDRTAAGSRQYSPPRTAWGDPDLQGMWPSDQLVDVPFERPAAFGTRTELTDGRIRRRAGANVGEAVDRAFSLVRDEAYQMFEYGCHEGNYAMANSLTGARARER